MYQHAALYVFPSLNEGFGIPVLEAFQAKIPLLVANNTCLLEVGADGVIGFDPYDENALAILMQEVLDDASVREALIQKGQERLKHFSWKKTANELLAVFEKTVHPKTKNV